MKMKIIKLLVGYLLIAAAFIDAYHLWTTPFSRGAEALILHVVTNTVFAAFGIALITTTTIFEDKK